MKNILDLLEQKRFKIFGHASSLAEARDYAEKLLQFSHQHEITEALDYYHNTLIEVIKQDTSRAIAAHRPP